MQQRDIEITNAYNAGNITLRRLGKKYGIGPERIRQIIIRTTRTNKEKEWSANILANTTEIKDIPIRAIGLSTRPMLCLRNMGAQTVGDIMQLTDKQMLETPNFGYACLKEVHKILKTLNHFLKNRKTKITNPIYSNGPLEKDHCDFCHIYTEYLGGNKTLTKEHYGNMEIFICNECRNKLVK